VQSYTTNLPNVSLLVEEEPLEEKQSQRVTPEACRDFPSFFHEKACVEKRASLFVRIERSRHKRGKPVTRSDRGKGARRGWKSFSRVCDP